MGRNRTMVRPKARVNPSLIKALEFAYYNNYVDTFDGFSEATLDRYLKQGFLENKHAVKKRQVYWISQKGLEVLRKHRGWKAR